jgi:stage II sporulation protein AA (anti-sigma F factor antagonist)
MTESVRTERNGNWLVARWPADIDMVNAGSAERQTLAAVRNTDEGVVVDLSDVAYIDSAGIRSLFGVRKLAEERQQRVLLVIPDHSPIKRALDVSGVMSIMEHTEALHGEIGT